MLLKAINTFSTRLDLVTSHRSIEWHLRLMNNKIDALRLSHLVLLFVDECTDKLSRVGLISALQVGVGSIFFIESCTQYHPPNCCYGY